MTRVDFYVLPEAEDPGPVPLACRLCEKAVKAGRRVFVYSPDEALLRDMDAALWTFRQGSFVAHERAEDCKDLDLVPVLLGAGEPPESHGDVLLNLSPELPAFFSRFDRMLEIVCGDARARAAARSRYRTLRDRGHPMELHRL